MQQADQCFTSVPAALHPLLERNLARVESALASMQALPEELHAQLARVLVGSDYVAEQLQRHPDWLAELISSGDLQQAYADSTYAERLQARLSTITDEKELHRQLRLFRQREMVRLIWRDLNRLTDMRGTTRELSRLADACIDRTLDWLYEQACQRWGVPHSRPDANGLRHPQRMVVLGMGKLGADELNLSSDIDLIFSFPANGETDGERKNLDNQDFFIRLGQKLIQALDNLTVDGFVFRVDMRLRPFGSAGPLACSFAAMESYYQDQGRDWERYAMIKARVVAGDKVAGAELTQLLRPFVYRKYIDFSAFESLRDMKAMINREVRRKGLDQNVKLGAGGIREVEFIAQAFQLIRGGRDAELQQRELLKILPLLPDKVGMPEEAVAELTEAYTFLRNVEHGIQAIADKQTQELPADEEGRARLAFAQGYADWNALADALDRYRATVSRHFADVIAPSEESEAQDDDLRTEWLALWQGMMDDESAQAFLAEQGYGQPQVALKALQDLKGLRTVQMLQQVALERLEAVLPALLEQAGQCDNPEVTLGRVLVLVQAVLRRSAYFVLLAENPAALKQLVRLCSASAWFAEQLSRQPVLLDELIDPRTLYSPPDLSALRTELRQQLLRIPEDDIEQLMETLRYFKHAHMLKVAASDITGVLPLMKVSDYLTWLAEAVLEAVLEIAWRNLTEKHGTPQRSPGIPCDPDFIIVGYGKVGGIELSYGSDLDLVFLHDAAANLETDGDRPIANSVFFNRLGQRIIHILNTFTPSGILYEVDMRLRPSGNSGLLVSSLSAFREYQEKDAWTWEHQALVRARVVAGSPALAERFEQERRAILSKPREVEQLRTEVAEMRAKMREHLGSKPLPEDAPSVFNLKQDRGGIVDIEFMVQYLVLRHAADLPELLRWTDNIRILDSIEAAGLLTSDEAELLREAYKAYRAAGHRLTLQNLSGVLGEEEMREYREGVAAIWQRLLGA
ncbi:bifunctional [glutamate--ammonia ligase]-adenylyl-L-tyrosine phosphorylase/[glutamate--ammonia-ligase] adenylyltransferase [Marinobacterium sediminicola]|uniref:Bifunctional glutamine synthetase adenylyltransferase/adenylyl-removing enzyme n=1 Tax=Marinobacterium sediminicola TaxID=518898 RepID=A0ABY1RZD0_9GAMM|nr:bifunctional [glutamate--ammonia ligase]-adenylyl-L-tyrosine phosphorylase/[glutamate--ammonia-ligase] adenylyltransferase [Marinobacterium sediminicola]ULG69107.1 bifunctional [glutamate--ammonia ligase]-adenylyl-L-tyrosine phosphorylase/[glutamate--ammonia-ligase] adenylyltransferase [Marinobacterium sediminicola]SMR73615.1 glutamate-ammonia-ligase adenylyltransferase [Marinobacterium sediminicola]